MYEFSVTVPAASTAYFTLSNTLSGTLISETFTNINPNILTCYPSTSTTSQAAYTVAVGTPVVIYCVNAAATAGTANIIVDATQTTGNCVGCLLEGYSFCDVEPTATTAPSCIQGAVSTYCPADAITPITTPTPSDCNDVDTVGELTSVNVTYSAGSNSATGLILVTGTNPSATITGTTYNTFTVPFTAYQTIYGTFVNTMSSTPLNITLENPSQISCYPSTATSATQINATYIVAAQGSVTIYCASNQSTAVTGTFMVSGAFHMIVSFAIFAIFGLFLF